MQRSDTGDMAQTRTYVRPDAALDAAAKAGIPENRIILVQNEQTGRWSYLRRPERGEEVTRLETADLPHPPRKRPVRAAKERPPKAQEARYALTRRLVVLNGDLIRRIDAARKAVKPGERVPNRSEVIRKILDRALPSLGADARR